MRYLLLTIFTCLTQVVWGQRIMLVHDSKDQFGNVGILLTAITDAGYSADVFDAAGLLRSPTDDEMSAYDLVIWYTSTDGVELNFWLQQDIDNGFLRSYLENSSGKLWVIGNDFLYDRYGAAPVTFDPGSFMYDHMGIGRYLAQSYGDDGGLGVPYLLHGRGDGTDDTLRWQFPTLWWADALEPVQDAKTIYRMGGEPGYPLRDLPAAILYEHPVYGSRVLTYGFDLSLLETPGLRRDAIGLAIDLFQFPSSVELALVTSQVDCFPNPAAQRVHFSLPVATGQRVDCGLLSLSGQEFFRGVATWSAQGEICLLDLPAGLPAGIYLLQIRSAGQSWLSRVVLQR